MTDKKNCDKSFGYKNIEPARNSSIFLPNIPGKNYEDLSLFDEISIFGSGIFDDSYPSDRDEFIYDELDYEDGFEAIPEAESTSSDNNIANTVADSTATENIADHIDVEIFESLTSAHTASGDASHLSTTATSPSASSASAPAVSARSASSITTTDTETSPAENSSPSVSASVGSASVGSASVGSASVGSASVGSASSVSASVGSASVGSASVGSASVGSASVGSASVGSASSASTTSVAACSVLDSLLASVQSSSASSSCNKRKRGPEPKSIGQLVPGPSYCATKKKPVNRPLSSRLSVTTYPVKTYKKPVVPKTVPLAASGSSGGPINGPIANVSAAIACSSFTPAEYAKKVKALELLTGQRDVSVNPFCKIVVTGIDPKPFRLVKKGLIDMTILVCKVVNIQFVGKTTEFTIYKSYKGTFLYKLASNPLITVISS
ncbi:hypothetical protein AYI70_g11361 [Smittium culicis]|uniref:Uncharacterized protein n=1 Tax=Smittium culicis TaxID=133412 RepID=A0A1R1X258_9FUNG|nr:hypothetical protein AYI70_g11361 [Smittium culicis]